MCFEIFIYVPRSVLAVLRLQFLEHGDAYCRKILNHSLLDEERLWPEELSAISNLKNGWGVFQVWAAALR